MPASDRYSGGSGGDGGGGDPSPATAAASSLPPADPFVTATAAAAAAAAMVHDSVSVSSYASSETYGSQESRYSGDSQSPISIKESKADHAKEKRDLEGSGDDDDSSGMSGGGGKFVIAQLEKFFYGWGGLVADHPFKIIVLCIFVTAACSVGFLNFRSEAQIENLWIPVDSSAVVNKVWKKEHFKEAIRVQQAMLSHDDDVLSAEAMLKLLDIHRAVNSVNDEGRTFQDFCVGIPISPANKERRRRRKRSAAKMDQEKLPEGTTVEEENYSESTEDYPDYGFNFYDWSGGDSGDVVDDVNRGEVDYEAIGEKVVKALPPKLFGGLPSDIYCDIVETLEDHCAERSILELWNYDEDVIRKLTRAEILEAVNDVKTSPVFGQSIDFTSFLGRTELDASGRVVGAKTLQSGWLTEFDQNDKGNSTTVIGVEFNLADPFTMEWERKLQEAFKEQQEKLAEADDGFRMLYKVERAFGDISTESLSFDTIRMICGYGVMFVYVIFMLGKLNRVEHRTYLAVAGLVSVLFGLIISMGMAFQMGYFYTPLHTLLPFLALGIGIDDMFVILQCMSNLEEQHGKGIRTVKEKIALTMQHAGVAITVTSVTDVMAFGVGACTVLPGLQAFCITCAIAIGAIFVLQSSWFVAWMTLDELRIKEKRDGLAPCIVHRDWTPPKFATKSTGKRMMSVVGNLFKRTPVQMLVLFVTAALLSVGVWGTMQIKVHFDPIKLMPKSSYLRRFADQADREFPTVGFSAEVYAGGIGYSLGAFESVNSVADGMRGLAEAGEYLTSAEMWWLDFKDFLNSTHGIVDWRDVFEHDDGEGRGQYRSFPHHLSDFLHHTEGGKSKHSFKFVDELLCDEPAPQITSMKLGKLTFRPAYSKEMHVPARAAVHKVIEDAKMPTETFTDSTIYAAWESDDVVGGELWRNLSLSMAAVLIITMIMLSSVKLCIFVLSCVTLTLVDVVGFIYFWGLTVDAISCVSVVLVVGLCVDYSAHIAHAFLVSKGSSQERAFAALTEMGPAILNGGITTSLALVFLSVSESYPCIVFFKVSILCVIFGLFHGLAFLPVILAMFGPDRLDIPDLKGLGVITESSPEEGAQQPQHQHRGGVSLLGRLFKTRSQQSWDLHQQSSKERACDNAGDIKVSMP